MIIKIVLDFKIEEFFIEIPLVKFVKDNDINI